MWWKVSFLTKDLFRWSFKKKFTLVYFLEKISTNKFLSSSDSEIVNETLHELEKLDSQPYSLERTTWQNEYHMAAIMHQRPKIQFFHEFAESRAMNACVITCLRATRFACQRVCVPAWFTCQCACVPICRKRANFLFYMLINVPTCHMACQCFNLACQRTKWCGEFWTWSTNVPKGVSSFQTFLSRKAKGNFCTLLLYKKFYILLDIAVIHIIYQGRSQNLKEVPQNFTEVFNSHDVTANDVIQSKQHHKEKINLSSIVITDVKLAS